MQPQAGHPPKLATPTAADHSAAPQRNALGDRSNDGSLLDSQISAAHSGAKCSLALRLLMLIRSKRSS